MNLPNRLLAVLGASSIHHLLSISRRRDIILVAYTSHQKSNNTTIVSNVSSNNLCHLYLLDEQFTTAGSAFNVLEHHLVLDTYILSNLDSQYGIIKQQTPSKLTRSIEPMIRSSSI